jgi:hypothetical protein
MINLLRKGNSKFVYILKLYYLYSARTKLHSCLFAAYTCGASGSRWLHGTSHLFTGRNAEASALAPLDPGEPVDQLPGDAPSDSK